VSGNSLRRVVHTHVPLLPGSINWYQPKGGDVLRLGRQPLVSYHTGHVSETLVVYPSTDSKAYDYIPKGYGSPLPFTILTMVSMKKWCVFCRSQVCVYVCVLCKSGVVNVLMTTPLWVANTRLKLQGTKLKNEVSSNGGCSPRERTHYCGLVGTLSLNKGSCIEDVRTEGGAPCQHD